MTLFRKVFQNQAHSASDEEALNEAALREAFSEQAEVSEGLHSDPLTPQTHEEDPVDAFEKALDAKLAGRVATEDDAHTEDGGSPVAPLRLTGAMPRRVRAAKPAETPVSGQEDSFDVAEDSDGAPDVMADDHGVDVTEETLETPVDHRMDHSLYDAEQEEQHDDALNAPDFAETDVDEEPTTSPEIDASGPYEEEEDTAADIAAVLQRVDAPQAYTVPEEATETAQDDEPAPAIANVMQSAEAPDADTPDEEPTEVPSSEETAAVPAAPAARDAADLVAFAQAQLKAMNPVPETDPESVDESAKPEEAAAHGDPEPLDLSEGVALDAVPAPAAGRAGRRSGRVKTRLLGFNRAGAENEDPFGTSETTATPQREKFPVGWLVIVEGPGLGHSFSLFNGASVIGRGDDQVIKLDFGDNAISRQNHAAIAYDDEQNKFYIGHGGKSNIIRRNARPVLSTEELHHADLIRIGETTLRFVALCGSDFKWETTEAENVAGV